MGFSITPGRAYGIMLVMVTLCLILGMRFIWNELYHRTADVALASVVVKPGESVQDLALRLQHDGIIRHPWLFRAYVKWRGIDRQIQSGIFEVAPPLTIRRITDVLAAAAARQEKEITIIPGWDLRDIAEYFSAEHIATETELFVLTGEPGMSDTMISSTLRTDNPILSEIPDGQSLEGYIAPDTYRMYVDEKVSSVLHRLLEQREAQLDQALRGAILASGHTLHEVMTVASIVEREVQSAEDRALVADIFWRRYRAGWLLQADSTVHYAVGKKGYLFTTKADRESDSPWNTYRFIGLPPGPIANPGLASIRAAVYPTSNAYWYFLTTSAGEVKYAKTLDEHNTNVAKYLR